MLVPCALVGAKLPGIDIKKAKVRGIAFPQMFAMREYPADVLPLYSQGYSLARYLIERGGRHKYVSFVGDGLAGCGATLDDPMGVKAMLEAADLVMAGNIKGFLDRYATPASIIAEADKRNLDYRMCASYTDGTKLCIEMAIIANA